MGRVYKTTYEYIYEFHAKFGRIPPKDRNREYWGRVADVMSVYSNDHNDEFTAALLLAVVDELEREYQAAGGIPTRQDWEGYKDLKNSLYARGMSEGPEFDRICKEYLDKHNM
jgi:hypothetical protein